VEVNWYWRGGWNLNVCASGFWMADKVTTEFQRNPRKTLEEKLLSEGQGQAWIEAGLFQS
jgi:hypothetical protein